MTPYSRKVSPPEQPAIKANTIHLRDHHLKHITLMIGDILRLSRNDIRAQEKVKRKSWRSFLDTKTSRFLMHHPTMCLCGQTLTPTIGKQKNDFPSTLDSVPADECNAEYFRLCHWSHSINRSQIRFVHQSRRVISNIKHYSTKPASRLL